MTADQFAHAERVADAVLYEGLVLYPYRKSALKNQFRWQFGIVAPRGTAPGGDPWFAQSECPVHADADASLAVRIRFLHLQRRTIEERLDDGTWRPCERTVVGGVELVSWDEAVACDVSPPELRLRDLDVARTFAFDVPGARDVEPVRDAAGAVVARVVRERRPIRFALTVSARAHDALRVLTVRVGNDGDPSAGADVANDGAGRDGALRRSLIGCHALLGIGGGGTFVSLLDPPAGAEAAVRACRNEHWWPVLAGPAGVRDVMLCAPIILYDHPAVAPESAGDFFDATEIDELLTLRVMTLTDAEKREVVATDEHARRVLERVEQTTPAMTMRLHGAVRAFESDATVEPPAWESFVNPPGLPLPEHASVVVDGVVLRQGSRVRLVPGARADAMDMFLRGRVARVAGVYHDLEDRVHVAVTLEDDPGADLRLALGRFFYFSPDELDPAGLEADAHA